MADTLVRLGTIGGPETFAGQTSVTMRRMFPILSEPSYFKSGSEMFAALYSHQVDAVIGAATNLTGSTEMADMVAEPNSAVYVIAEAQLPFGCHLLGRQGATADQVKLIHGGPASIAQARQFLDEHLPQAATHIYSDPMATGEAISKGDATTAVLGTRALAERFGLTVLAAEIDGGKVNGNWWALSTLRLFDDCPNRLIVAGRWCDEGGLGRVIMSLGQIGYGLATISSRATGHRLFEADYVLRLSGYGSLKDVEAAIAKSPGARLAGAMRVSQ